MLKEKLNILFLCTGNSCRSQMAEGFCRDIKSDSINAYSAGTTTHGLNPRAVKVMAEQAIDIGNHTSQTVADLGDIKFDYIFTVCGHAHENCPYFSQGKIVHTGFDDPPFLTKEMSDEEEIMSVYRRVSSDIKEMIIKIESKLL